MMKTCTYRSTTSKMVDLQIDSDFLGLFFKIHFNTNAKSDFDNVIVA